MSGQYAWKIGKPPPILGAHSVAKHDIVERYLGIYIDRLTRTPAQTVLNLTVVDGFSGGGIYRRGSAEVDGSPLRLLAAIEGAEKGLSNARTKGFDVRADFFFVDSNAHHVTFLRDILQRRGYGPRLGHDIFVIQANFEDVCGNIITHIKNKGPANRSLFLLDQYGWSDIRLSTIRSILVSLKNPEILLTFSVDALIDFLSTKTADARSLLNIDLDRQDVRELIHLKAAEGWRYLIQNRLYRHIQDRTKAKFYTPFFIYSPQSHRSYWLLHLSNHRQARDEMGKLHWKLQNHFQHLGGAGFHALGFDPSKDIGQNLMPFMFDDDAMRRSEAAVLDQLPKMIHAADRQRGGLVVEELFVGNCNDTPVTSDILSRKIAFLRDEGELLIVSPDGSKKLRAKSVSWDDRLILPSKRSMFSSLGW